MQSPVSAPSKLQSASQETLDAAASPQLAGAYSKQYQQGNCSGNRKGENTRKGHPDFGNLRSEFK